MISDLLAARAQMAVSLAFHIIFAAVGMAMPLLMLLAEARWLRRRRSVDLELAKRWAKGTAIMFAVGAVSGTVLSFELGLLWPAFMRHAGPIIGMPFSLEGAAFFLEAIFLGIYIYGWDRVPPRAHWLAGLVVMVSGVSSGMLVICANGWMNAPTGFELIDGRFTQIDPVAAMLNPAALWQGVHMTIAAFEAVGFAVAAIHALMLLRHPPATFHRRALAIALTVGATSAALQLVTGDLLSKRVAATQPVKLAAMEGQWNTQRRAPLRIGGIPDEQHEVTRWAVEIPGGLSFLAHGDIDAEVVGLSAVPRDERPPVAITHVAFQIMIGCGMALFGLSLLAALLAWRRRGLPDQRWFLWLVTASGPLGFVAIEAGWCVTEVGRQPWVIYRVMRTADAVTPMPGLVFPLTVFSLLYLLLGVTVIALLRSQVFATAPHAARRR